MKIHLIAYFLICSTSFSQYVDTSYQSEEINKNVIQFNGYLTYLGFGGKYVYERKINKRYAVFVSFSAASSQLYKNNSVINFIDSSSYNNVQTESNLTLGWLEAGGNYYFKTKNSLVKPYIGTSFVFGFPREIITESQSVYTFDQELGYYTKDFNSDPLITSENEISSKAIGYTIKFGIDFIISKKFAANIAVENGELYELSSKSEIKGNRIMETLPATYYDAHLLNLNLGIKYSF